MKTQADKNASTLLRYGVSKGSFYGAAKCSFSALAAAWSLKPISTEASVSRCFTALLTHEIALSVILKKELYLGRVVTS